MAKFKKQAAPEPEGVVSFIKSKKDNKKGKTRNQRTQSIKKSKPVEFVAYNEDERREFVTGFHKRKLAAHKLKVEKAKNRDKEAKRENIREKRAKISKVIPLVKEIDAILEKNDLETTVKKTKGLDTVTTVTVTEFDPNSIDELVE
ncbi:hypothetical protein BC833DRAFT_568545 [Globomyces pollinis-pini]|nr:hypothetical protein BC833DRAFT_568545 [Globomyces pollinis-pini]